MQLVNFIWGDEKLGDTIKVTIGESVDSYMLIQSSDCNYYDLMCIDKEDCEYSPLGLKYPSHKMCIEHILDDMFDDCTSLELVRLKDVEDAFDYAVLNGFKPAKIMSLNEIEKELGYKIALRK